MQCNYNTPLEVFVKEFVKEPSKFAKEFVKALFLS